MNTTDQRIRDRKSHYFKKLPHVRQYVIPNALFHPYSHCNKHKRTHVVHSSEKNSYIIALFVNDNQKNDN